MLAAAAWAAGVSALEEAGVHLRAALELLSDVAYATTTELDVANRGLERSWEAARARRPCPRELTTTCFLSVLGGTYWRHRDTVRWVDRGLARPHIAQSPGRRAVLEGFGVAPGCGRARWRTPGG